MSSEMFVDPIVRFLAIPAGAYVIGSTPFAVMISKLRGVDLRKAGSGNVGATNVARAVGFKFGVFCFVLDVMKGLLPTLAAGNLLGVIGSGIPAPVVQAAWLAAGCGCIIGHVFSFYLRGRGGKGVATSLGVVLGVYPYMTFPAIAAFLVWGVVTFLSRYVSLGSIVASVLFLPIFVAINAMRDGFSGALRLWPMGCFILVMVVLIVYKHRVNIRKLLDGQEYRMGGGGSNGQW